MPKDKIRFLATGDFHSDLKLINNIKQYNDLNSIDFIVFTGDLSEKNNDFKKLLNVFKGKQIFMVPGNHETKTKLKKLEDHYNVHMIGNKPVRVHKDLVLFGTNYLGIGHYGISEQQVFDNLLANFDAIKDAKCKIHLSHIPPDDTKIANASPFFPFIKGSEAVRVFLDNFHPDLTLCGHIHETSGLEEIVNKTKVVNVAQTSKLFEFDTKTSKLKILN